MNIQILGLNHKTAHIHLRERLSFAEEKLPSALAALKEYDSIEENLILSTCNRVEIYAAVRDISAGFNSIQNFICNFHKIRQNDIKNHIYLFTGIEAIRHLFRVVSSLDSMIIGETQIFGQVKDAYFKARGCKTVGKNLIGLFEEAIKAGKMVRTETKIGKGVVSISSTAVELAKKLFESLGGKTILIIGAGKVGELTVKSLYKRGVDTVLVANRTFEKSKALARDFHGKAIKFEEIFESLKDIDILISSISASHFIIKKDHVRQAMRDRDSRGLFLIDLGLPRNIDPKVNEIENTYLYNIDDLAKVRDANIKERLLEAEKVEEIIERQINRVAQKLLKTI